MSADRLSDAVASHLKANGDWNVNDWRDVASALAAELARVKEENERYRKALKRIASSEPFPLVAKEAGPLARATLAAAPGSPEATE